MVRVVDRTIDRFPADALAPTDANDSTSVEWLPTDLL